MPTGRGSFGTATDYQEGVMRRDAGAARASAEVERVGTGVRKLLRGRLSDFRLELCGQGVVLHGKARSYYAKQLAQHAVMRETDLPIVRNGIEVA
jgi:hypothetical protein